VLDPACASEEALLLPQKNRIKSQGFRAKLAKKQEEMKSLV